MGTFSQDISKFVKKTGLRADTVLRKVALDAYGQVIQKSPVDTGRFRGNWQVGIDRIDDTTFQIVPERSAGVDAKAPPRPEEIAEAQRKLARARFGNTIIISNSLPYARRLENGWSKQAPQGMVAITLAEVTRNVQQSIRKLEQLGL